MQIACQSISLSDISGFPCLVVKGLELNQCVAGSGIKGEKAVVQDTFIATRKKEKKKEGVKDKQKKNKIIISYQL